MAREQTLEQLRGAHLRGPLRTQTSEPTQPWAGRTTVPSGSATVTVSTALVNSDSIIMITEAVNSLDSSQVNSGSHLVSHQSSIVSGTSFNISRAGGGAVAWDSTAMWMIIQT